MSPPQPGALFAQPPAAPAKTKHRRQQDSSSLVLSPSAVQGKDEKSESSASEPGAIARKRRKPNVASGLPVIRIRTSTPRGRKIVNAANCNAAFQAEIARSAAAVPQTPAPQDDLGAQRDAADRVANAEATKTAWEIVGKSKRRGKR